MATPSAQDFNFSSHEYTSLPSPSSIRLLSLVDDSGCPQKASICGIRVMQYTLMTVDLNDDPDYDALSYTWGSPFPILGGSRIPPEYATTSRWPIAVNGKLFFITKNLFDALSGLHSDAPLKGVHKRYPPYNKTELIRASEEGREADVRRQPNNGASVDLRRPIWIDAVCVNQNDILERNAQVSMMARIYKSAQQVKIWLGPEDISPEKVIDRVASSGSGKAPKVKDISIGYSKAHLQPLVVWTSVNGEHEIKELLRRTWFSRIWVIQELALAKSVKILCGKHQFDGTHLFERILKDLSVVTNSGEIGCIGDVNMKSMLGVEARACLLADAWIRERTESTGRQHSARTTHCFQGNILPGVDMRLSLPILLALTRDFQASDPRDKIFAILGLSRLPGRHSIKIDYSRSVVDIYTEVGRIFVEACGNNEFQDSNTGEMQDLEPLEGLSFVQVPIIEHNECYYCKDLERTPDLPSWVPDFKNPLVTPPLFCKRFRAAAGSQYTTYKATDRILRLSGGLFDRITEIERDRTCSNTCMIPGGIMWLHFISNLDVTYPTGINRVEALWRTVILDRPGEDKAGFRKELCRQFQDSRAEFGKNVQDLELLQGLTTAENSDLLPTVAEASATAGGAVGHCFCFHIRKRLLFRTEKGYLGLGPHFARAGDQVWILAGARVPFVLRDASTKHGPDSFELVGESYVHGIMQGEAVAAEDFHFSPINLV